MSDDAVAVVGRWFVALESGDPAPELCDPEVEIRNWDNAPITGPYFGHEGVQQWWADVADAVDDLHFELEHIEAIDEHRALTIQQLAGRFRLTGIEVRGAWAAIITIRDGKILKAIGYASPGLARRAAGLE